MSNLNITPQWHDNINQVETGEAIVGGANGNANIATRQLAENLFFLKGKIETTPAQSQNQTDGWVNLPGGLIMQWGTVDYATFPSHDNVTIDFPKPFEIQCLNFQSTRKVREGASGYGDADVLLIKTTKSTAEVYLERFSDSYGDARGFTWFAIGY